jgi:CelD/BcsL family acetyltransferase involved in cellulose biosynthesis
VTYDLVATRAGFDALETEWNALFARAGRGEQMFQQFNWLWHWANHYTDASTEFAILTGRRGGRLVLVWPAVIERPARLRQLAWMGDPVSQYGDVVVDDLPDRETVLARAWSALLDAARPDLVRFAKVRGDAAVAPLLAAKGFEVVCSTEAPAIALPAHGTFARFETRFSAKHLKNRRRQLRRLEERGAVEIAAMRTGREAVAAARHGIELKRAWLHGKGLVSRAFADRRIDAFFADVAAGATRPAGVSVSVLRSAGTVADVNIAVTCKGRRALHVIAYAPEFERCGAGCHHMARDIARAFDEGVAVYDFLAPRHDYKMEWADHVVAVGDHALAVTPVGRAYARVYLALIREGAKRMLNALPKPLATTVARLHRRLSPAA